VQKPLDRKSKANNYLLG